MFLGEGVTRGWANGDKGRDEIVSVVSGSIVAPFECPTSMRRL